MMLNPRLIDLTGQRFGRWTVLRQAGNTVRGGAIWACLCDCGGAGTPSGCDLRAGKSTSCICSRNTAAAVRFTTHGGTGTRLYRIWKAMHTRCTNPNTRNWKDYGGRGITICQEWRDFAIFRAWAIKSGYTSRLSIERMHVNGNYAPNNCTWATPLEQSINRRFVLRSTTGEAWSQIAKRNGIPVTLMHSRIYYGWPIEQASTLPKGTRIRTVAGLSR